MDTVEDCLDSIDHFLGKKRKENCIDDSDWGEVKYINGYAVFMGYLLMGVRGLGILVVTWTTVVLLGGFVSVLGKNDFWCLTGITLVQMAGVFNFLLEEKLSDILHSSWGLFGAVLAMVFKSNRRRSSKKSQDPSSTQEEQMIHLPSLKHSALANVLSFIQLLMLAVILCPLAVMYMLGLYISTGVSLWRLIKHDFGNGDGSANLKPALEVLYSLAVAQGVLFGYKEVHAFGAKIGLAELVAEYCSVDKKMVSDYLDNIVEGCEKDPSFATGRNLVTYAVHLMLEPKSNDCFIVGVRALGTIIKNYKEWGHLVLAKHLLTRSASCSHHVISKLLEVMGPRSPYSTEIREKAARIVVLVAGSIRLEQFPGGIQCISSLFDTPEEYSWQPDGYERNSYLPKDYERDWLLKEYERYHLIDYSTVNKLTSPGSDYKTRVIQGLCILQDLAVDEDNCRVISNTEGLCIKTMEPLTSDELHRNHHEVWRCSIWRMPWRVAAVSLELMNRLMATPGETGTKLRREISSNNKVISTLKIIVECGECTVELKRQAVQIILDPFVDTSSIIAGGSSRIFIWILLDIVLLTDYCFRKTFGSTHWAKKSSDIRRLAREKLQAMLSLESERSSAMSILQSVRVVLEDLTRTLVEARNNANRLQAAQFLERLCDYYTKDDEYLKELKKAMVDVMPQVLSEILGYGSTRKEIPAATETGSVQFPAPGTDLESGVASHGNGQGNTSSSHQQNREQQSALIELCEAISVRWRRDVDTTHQLNEIAARICSEQEKPVKEFSDIIFTASLAAKVRE